MKYYIRELRKIKRATVALAEQLFSELKVIKKNGPGSRINGKDFSSLSFYQSKNKLGKI
jgi:hypothetical protein